ncbi:MAG: hypothetical protein AB7F41_16075 [Methylocystis sp.]|uniref:hypothetical protein n=1 Tax=Methylocystis sp. TaxID=1911079 RepID=UPI003D0BDBD1
MTGTRMKLAAALALCGAGCFLPVAASGQGAEGYSAYRQSLMAEGWKPNVAYGLKTAKGSPLYKFPEVVCGPTLCNAKWRDPQGREKLIRLIRGLNGADHRVAP